MEPGLSDTEIAAAEREFAIRIPADLRQVLQVFLPLDAAGRAQDRLRWPDWRSGPGPALAARLIQPWEGIEFDLKHNDLWPDAWGTRPASLPERIVTARRRYDAAPRLVPVFIHRYIPGDPPTAGNPVLSVHQTDVIHYGLDLVGYFHAEFHVPPPAWAATHARPIRFWDDLL